MNKIAVSALISSIILSGCAASGEQYASNVYQAGQVNQRQSAKTVDILAVLPAKVQVDNTQNKKTAQVVGGILGAVAGIALGASLGHGGQGFHQTNAIVGGAAGAVGGAAAGSIVDNTTLVDGVSLTYKDEGQVFNSAQVGRACEFKAGLAVMISTSPTETRIQPNSACPAQQ